MARWTSELRWVPVTRFSALLLSFAATHVTSMRLANAKGCSQAPALWLKPREEPPPVLLLGICCWLFVPMRHGFLNLVSPKLACLR